ncbi:antibiotic biosynthesis monooxygenase [Iodobacter sp. LRB]|uniref:putative quinol monooxygenase n=1 Tax=unclassified Iodobacter TaxID=235634 RepID=UPI000C0E3FCB|nr:antibiotic biosynthesis monooxygenase [Iodobacter sp. BJB302]PHU99873.1 antibiotic biosynthesis monooxygenase [Iodobacter sp. BJB302]
MPHLFVSAVIKANPEKDLDTVRGELKRMILASHSEVDCFKFECLEDLDEVGTFVLWEEWASSEALAQHFKEAHTQHYLQQNLTTVATIHKLNTLN